VTGLTILIKHGLSFQGTHTVHSATLKTQTVMLNGLEYIYHGIKKTVFYNDLGIEKNANVAEASLERAMGDIIYYTGGKYQFEDYLDSVDWPKLKSVGKIYGKKSVERFISDLEGRYANNS
jgi:hypothetical protein